jgi:hypothetical protein
MTEREYLKKQTGPLSAMFVILGGFLSVVMGVAAAFTGTNAMLAALAARTHEIGVLLATGFRPYAIFVSFLFEAAILGLLGGILGVLIVLPLNGMRTGTTNFSTFTEVSFPFRTTPFAMAVAVAFAILLGLLGGAFPALRAARMTPTRRCGALMASNPLRPLAVLYRDAFGGLPALDLGALRGRFINRCGSMVVPFLSLYLKKEFDYSAAQAGGFLSAYGLGAFAGSWLGGWLTDRHGPVRTQIATLASTGVWMLLMTQIREPWLLAISVFVLGVLNDAFRPGSLTAVAISCEPPCGARRCR